MPPSLVLVIAAAAVAVGAAVPPTDSATPAPCAILEERCQCTPDLQEFVCRTAGFTEVPQNLPYSIAKL
ncbi:hypothetical protein BDFB_007467 [Asbolus verrucosus]|uniref:Uncharacterized protein n=1 Tax=Asbolus verrucosus TaxID=1661398 RepID=A0A482VVH4_ASBVE|nr:hypothetical protein BDFB_007467 [Asbolus verrucosus]